MTIDLVVNFFDFGTPQAKRLINSFRQEIFEEISKSDLDGMIFTYIRLVVLCYTILNFKIMLEPLFVCYNIL